MLCFSDSPSPLRPLKRVFPPAIRGFPRSFPILLCTLALCLPACEETILKPPPGMTDTTTHDWRFEVDTLGGWWSGARDVVAFSRDDAYVTGEFRVYPDPNDIGVFDRYNLAHWDGRTWTLLQVFLKRPGYPPDALDPGRSLAALPNHDIILTMEGGTR